MSSLGIFLSEGAVSSGNPYNGQYNYLTDFSGYYKVMYSYLADGNIPICYAGINALSVFYPTSSLSSLISFPDLSSDVPADIISWLTSAFGQIAVPLGVNVVSVTQVAGGYNVKLNHQVTLQFSFSVSNSYRIFGSQNLVGVSNAGNFDYFLSDENLDARPKFLGFTFSQSSPVYLYGNFQGVTFAISCKDDLLLGEFVYFPNTQNQLNLVISRINAINIPCPIPMKFMVLLGKTNTNGTQ